MAATPGPRLFGIAATDAPVVAVVRRGPSDWCQLLSWHLDTGEVEPGAWIHGVIAPQKCDLSPDGRWFAASIHQPTARWPVGTVYESISRLPWLRSLAAWGTGTTYTRGIRFAEPGVDDLGPADHGDAGPCVARYGLAWGEAVQFAVERRRGWVEAPGTPPREAGGPFDEHRDVTMAKPQPGGPLELRASGGQAAFRSSPQLRTPPRYVLRHAPQGDGEDREGSDTERVLHHVQWADWHPDGRLLVATIDGRLQIRSARPAAGAATTARHGPGPAADHGVDHEVDLGVDHEVDLSGTAPAPTAAPPWARSW